MLTCFLVEDSPLIRHNLVAALEELLPLRVLDHREDQDSAIAWLADATQPCDLVIIDLFLKRGSGLEVLRQARRLRPAARLVVLSNYATPDVRRRAAQLGADRVFDKSAELEDLLAYCATLTAAG
ncbi:MAG: response regulator transcription factor [Burkholderiaceae bacterium]|nr:response regulator transcription factor [Burkholderiaceae bacterium]